MNDTRRTADRHAYCEAPLPSLRASSICRRFRCLYWVIRKFVLLQSYLCYLAFSLLLLDYTEQYN